MGGVSFFAGRWWARLRAHQRAHPGLTAALALLLLYGAYLPTTGYVRFYYDSEHYWVMGQQYWKTGRFSLLSYTDSMRGYLFSLLLSPFSVAAPHLGLSPVQLMRPLGMLTAAVFFGLMAPALWRAVVGPGAPAVSVGRRLVFGLLGFALWRDYFNFPLTDFPALFALCLALWALLRGNGLALSLLAGGALAAAVNMRPVFQVALPFAALLALLPAGPARPGGPSGRWAGWGRVGAFAAGFGLVLAPQLCINAYNFGARTPWVLAYKQSNPTDLLLNQLKWGLQYQKYETSAASDYPLAEMFFLDDDGQVLFAETRLERFTSQAQYWQLVRQHPLRAASVWTRHLLNGLDIQYPTPYVTRVYERSWPLAWLNYTVLFAGAGVLISVRQRGGSSLRTVLVLATLLTPCLSALLVAIECRFMLPLHMVLSGALAFAAPPVAAWRQAARRSRVAWLLGYLVFVAAAFAFSTSAQRHLEKGPRKVLQL